MPFTWSSATLPEALVQGPANTVTVTTIKGEPQGNQNALGEPVVGAGRHIWEIKILDSWRNWGDGMLIGVMDATVELNEPKGVKAWCRRAPRSPAASRPATSPHHPAPQGSATLQRLRALDAQRQ